MAMDAGNLTPNPFPSGKGNRIVGSSLFPSGNGDQKNWDLNVRSAETLNVHSGAFAGADLGGIVPGGVL